MYRLTWRLPLAGLVAFSHLQFSQIRGRQPYLIDRSRDAPLLGTPHTDPCEPDSGTRLPRWVIDGEALAGPGMEDMRFREPLVDQLLYSFPREAVPLAAPPEQAKPEMGDVVTEPCKCATIRRHRMIVEVAC